MKNKPNQGLQTVIAQLTRLTASVEGGASNEEIIAELQDALGHLCTLQTYDVLTGALNRHGLLQKLDAELQRAHRTGHPFSFAVISIDHFARLASKHGNLGGDHILKVVAEKAMDMLRVLDSFGRTDEHEFAIIMPTTWLDQSVKAIQRLTTVVAGADWSGLATDLSITFSTGLTTNATGDTADAMLKRAKQALADASAKGPGQIAQLELGLQDFDPSLL
jgi:diguanylate cyclase (GGDEF)-like protein